MQNAVFRREPNVSPYHHIIVDEFPDYVVRPFKEFPAQSRKYKVILTIASQTLSQLALDFTEQYMFTLLGSFRNKMIFGDVTPYDAKKFSLTCLVRKRNLKRQNPNRVFLLCKIILLVD